MSHPDPTFHQGCLLSARAGLSQFICLNTFLMQRSAQLYRIITMDHSAIIKDFQSNTILQPSDQCLCSKSARSAHDDIPVYQESHQISKYLLSTSLSLYLCLNKCLTIHQKKRIEGRNYYAFKKGPDLATAFPAFLMITNGPMQQE